MPRGRKPGPPKDKFEDLDDDYKSAVAGMDEVAIRERIAKVSLDQASLMEAKELDADLKLKKEVSKEAGAIYREGTKMNKLRIEFARRVLGDKGKETGDSGLPN